MSRSMESRREEPLAVLEGAELRDQRILVVDDDQAILFMLQQFLSDLGVEVTTAQDGVEALERLQEGEFTMVITDLLMPRLGGMELTRRIKEEWPQIDVMVMTGYGKEFSYTDVIRAGASDFIQKPFHLNEMEAKLNRLARERAMRIQLEMLAVRDPLTGLFNRRYFEQKMEEEVERARRQGYPIYLFMVDLDNFKELNDTLGHQEGDRVLQGLARVLASSTRRYVDWVFRYGGDEFVVIVPHASHDQVLKIGNRIRENFASLPERRNTSLSIGVSCLFCPTCPNVREEIHRLVREADEAMYEAKARGGDQVYLHPSVEACMVKTVETGYRPEETC